MIKYAALMIDDNGHPLIITGKNHGDCFRRAKELNMDRISCCNSQQGFVNSKMRFLNRRDSGYEAKKCGQIKDIKSWNGELFSEDLDFIETIPMFQIGDHVEFFPDLDETKRVLGVVQNVERNIGMYFYIVKCDDDYTWHMSDEVAFDYKMRLLNTECEEEIESASKKT